jgi:PleD family two-component response regulator
MQTAVKMHASVLVVDDEARQLAALCDTLEDTGYKATGFTSARHALAALRESEFDLLLLVFRCERRVYRLHVTLGHAESSLSTHQRRTLFDWSCFTKPPRRKA